MASAPRLGQSTTKGTASMAKTILARRFLSALALGVALGADGARAAENARSRRFVFARRAEALRDVPAALNTKPPARRRRPAECGRRSVVGTEACGFVRRRPAVRIPSGCAAPTGTNAARGADTKPGQAFRRSTKRLRAFSRSLDSELSQGFAQRRGARRDVRRVSAASAALRENIARRSRLSEEGHTRSHGGTEFLRGARLGTNQTADSTFLRGSVSPCETSHVSSVMRMSMKRRGGGVSLFVNRRTDETLSCRTEGARSCRRGRAVSRRRRFVFARRAEALRDVPAALNTKPGQAFRRSTKRLRAFSRMFRSRKRSVYHLLRQLNRVPLFPVNHKLRSVWLSLPLRRIGHRKGANSSKTVLKAIVFGAGLCEACKSLRSGSESVNHRSLSHYFVAASITGEGLTRRHGGTESLLKRRGEGVSPFVNRRAVSRSRRFVFARSAKPLYPCETSLHAPIKRMIGFLSTHNKTQQKQGDSPITPPV